MKKSLIAIGLFGIMLFANCTKTPSATHILIDSFLVKNFNYKPGTYWVYKDSITGEEDSFYVHDNVSTSTSSGNNYNSLEDNININIYQNSSANIKQANWFVNMNGKVLDIRYSGNITIEYVYFLIVPYQLGLLNNSNEDSGYVVSINNSVSINKKTYAGVVITKHKNNLDSLYPSYNNTFFINNDMGIIKMVLNQGTLHNIWELEKCNIVK